MDKADFTFLIAAFLYMGLVLTECTGLIHDSAVLALFAIILSGILFTTTVVKVNYYLRRANRSLNIIGVVLAAMVFILSIIIFFKTLNS